MADVKDAQIWRFVYQFIVEGWEQSKRSLQAFDQATVAAATGTEKLTRAEWDRARKARAAHPDFKLKYDLLLKSRMALKDEGWEIQQLNKDQVRLVQSTKARNSETFAGVAQYELVAKAMRQYGWQVQVVTKQQQKQLDFWPAWQQAISRYGGMRGGLLFRWARESGGAWWQVAMGMLVVQRVAETVAKALKRAMDQAADTEKLRAATSAYQAWGDASSVATRRFMQGVQEATHFAGVEYDAITLANRQVLSGYEELAEAIPQLSETAYYHARAVGETTAAVLKSWVASIRDADTESLEAEQGFTGLTDAVEQLAEETYRTVEQLSEEEKIVVILNELLPQMEQRTLDLARSQGTLAEDTKSAWTGVGKWISDAMAYFFMPSLSVVAPDPEILARNRWALQEMLEQKNLWDEIKRMYKEGEIDEATLRSAQERMRSVTPRRRVSAGALSEEELLAATKHLRSVVYGEEPQSEYFGMSPDAAVALQEYQKQLKITRDNEKRLSDEVKEAYTDADEALEERIVGLVQQGVSTETIMEMLKTKGDELRAIYDELGAKIFEPEGMIRLEQFNMGLDVEIDLLEQVRDRQEDINDTVSDFIVEAMDMGLPYIRALQLGLEMRDQIDELGDLTTETARHSMSVIEDAFDDMLYRMGRGVDSLMGKMIGAAMDVEKALQGEAKGTAVRIAPYTGMGNVEAFYEGYMAELRQWQFEFGKDPESLTAMARREEIDTRWEKIAKDLEKAATRMGEGTSDLKKAAEAMLLSSAAGNAALAYEIEHGTSPLSAYARHEEPLTAWMMDKLAGEQYAKEHGGEAPSEDWWKARWFKEWYPLEQFHAPGAPIMAPTGPEAETARARLAEQGVGEETQTLADIWHNEYLARKKLIPPLESSADKFITLDEATGNLIKAFEDAAKRLNKPPGGEEETPPGKVRNYPGWSGNVHTDTEGITWYRAESGEDRWVQGPSTDWQNVPGFAQGIYTGARSGLAQLHPNELILPLSDRARTNELLNQALGRGQVSMPGGGSGGGGVVIQMLSIPVHVNAPVSARMAREIGASVAGIGSRLGTQIVRAAQRAGLS